MRIDAHQHFWRYSAEEYGWIDDRMAVLRRDFLPTDLEPLLAGQGIDRCVAVQARQTLEETEWLLSLAEEHAFVAGVVGWADLRADDAADQLDRFASNPKLVGIRHVVQDEPDDEFLLRDDFCRGVGLLAERGLTYDILVYPKQLPAAVRFVERFPDQLFVLDHVAKPLVTTGELEPWATHVRELAAHAHVACKVSGLVTEADWSSWTPESFDPYLDVVLEAFRPGRLMFGSDWPVCLLAADYPAVHGIATRYLERLAPAERDGILGANAARFYGIEA